MIIALYFEHIGEVEGQTSTITATQKAMIMPIIPDKTIVTIIP